LIVGIDASGKTTWEVQLAPDEEVVGVGAEFGKSTWYISTQFPAEGEVTPPRVRALDVETGEVSWMVELRSETTLQWANPALFSDLIVIMDVPRVVAGRGTTTRAHLIALDRDGGDELWTTDLADTSEAYSDGLLAHDAITNLLVAATPGGDVFSVAPQTGRVLWHTETGFVRILGLDAKVAILQSGEGELALDLQTGEPVAR
jgi:outer membrane protein assembly factor BamB